MQSLSILTLVGFSHRTAPVSVRERYAISPGDLPACLAMVKKLPGVEEAYALSTCNRTEILVASAYGHDPTDEIMRAVFRNIESEHLYYFHGVQAVIHVFRVAAGLDSMIVGESEVLAQLKRSLDAAVSSKAIDQQLRPLLQQAIQVGKRVRRETGLGQGTLSVARVGVDVAEHVFGRFGGCSALIIGAGETGVLTARNLLEKGIGRIAFANRTLSRAEKAVAELGGSAHGLDELPTLVNRADIVLACVDGGQANIGLEIFDKRALGRRDRPLLIIDLSVPRAVDSRLADYDGVLLYDLDDLERVVEKNRRGREDIGANVDEMLVGEVHKFLSLRTFARFSPAIERLRERFSEVRDQVVDEVCGAKASGVDIELAHALERKLLDVALSQMKESARHASSADDLGSEYQKFMENL